MLLPLPDVFDIYDLISSGSKDINVRNQSRMLRKAAFDTLCPKDGFTKVAFDTRRIDQETGFNPRRGLQNYNRSEAFVSEAMSQKVKNFAKLRTVLNTIHDKYGREHEWQDSNARVLLSTLDNGLRTFIKDGDFTDSQPSMGSFDYIEELLHVRYRLGFDDLTKLGEQELEHIILSKDEDLLHKDMNHALEIRKSDIGKENYNDLIEKLLADCRASAEHPNVEREITIRVRDTFLEKKGA
jgi:hypothetical protein